MIRPDSTFSYVERDQIWILPTVGDV
jgi:hypothetical protein